MAKYLAREVLEVALNYRLSFLKAENGEYDHYTCGFDEAVTTVENFPEADVAPVVRCKDCEYAERYERTNGTAGYYCGHPKNRFTYGERWDRVFKPVKEANDFCSYGEYQTNMGGVTNE